jgi:hypothetical protein
MRTLILGVLCATLAGCGASASAGTAQAAADATTKAVYADDFNAVTPQFDSALRTQISRGEVGMLSDKLRALGAYTGLTLLDGDPVKNEYVYKAAFDKGSMSVAVRLDSNGQLSAYRLIASK